jgi:hypothetical protein
MDIQYYRVYPSSHGRGVGLPPVLPAESSTKPARFACLAPAALPLSPAACLLPACRYRLPRWTALNPAACRKSAALLALPAVTLAPAFNALPPAVRTRRLYGAVLPMLCLPACNRQSEALQALKIN